MSGDPSYTLVDRGDTRVLTVDGREHVTRYSQHVVRMLIARKGARRAALYLPFKETRGHHFLGLLFRFLRARGATGLRVLEVGCSFGHNTEYVAEQPTVAAVHAFDTDPAFVAITRAKVAELGLTAVREVVHLAGEATLRLPWPDAAFDVVLVVGVIEHLPMRWRRRQVDEYYRVLAPGGHIAILDTPNRAFPLETHSVGLPGVQWLPARLAYHYARLGRPRVYGRLSFEEFAGDGVGWMNASWWECLPSAGLAGFEDLSETIGYGWRFFRATARSRTRRALLPAFAVAVATVRVLGWPPSVCLPYFNLAFRRTR